MTTMDSVYCMVQTHFLNKREYLSSFKGLIASYCYCLLQAWTELGLTANTFKIHCCFMCYITPLKVT